MSSFELQGPHSDEKAWRRAIKQNKNMSARSFCAGVPRSFPRAARVRASPQAPENERVPWVGGAEGERGAGARRHDPAADGRKVGVEPCQPWGYIKARPSLRVMLDQWPRS